MSFASDQELRDTFSRFASFFGTSLTDCRLLPAATALVQANSRLDDTEFFESQTIRMQSLLRRLHELVDLINIDDMSLPTDGYVELPFNQ